MFGFGFDGLERGIFEGRCDVISLLITPFEDLSDGFVSLCESGTSEAELEYVPVSVPESEKVSSESRDSVEMVESVGVFARSSDKALPFPNETGV